MLTESRYRRSKGSWSTNEILDERGDVDADSQHVQQSAKATREPQRVIAKQYGPSPSLVVAKEEHRREEDEEEGVRLGGGQRSVCGPCCPGNETHA